MALIKGDVMFCCPAGVRGQNRALSARPAESVFME